MTATYLTIILFFLFISIELPISVSLILGMVISVAVFDVYPMISMSTLLFSSLNSYLLVAIPLFMLAGISMSQGGVAKRIFDFSESILSYLPGSLGAVNIMGSLLFGGMSGSSVADVAGLGSVEIKEMVKRKYSLQYATAITVASSTMSVIIPPSILLIIYATVANDSVGKMLAAGLFPGLFIGALMILANTYFAIKNKWGDNAPFSLSHTLKTGVQGFPALMAPVIILWGIFSGFFTATEASVVAFVYSLGLGVIYRELSWKKLYKIVYEGGRTVGIVVLELASGLLFANLMTLEGIPETLTASIVHVSDNPVVILLLINAILLVAGMFLNPGFSIIVFTPLLLPLATAAGIETLHFGIIMITNLALGLITPPVGACLYVGSVISGLRIDEITKKLIPFYLVMVFALIMITLLPQMSQGFAEWLF